MKILESRRCAERRSTAYTRFGFLSLGRRRLGRIIKLVLVNQLYIVKNKRDRIFMDFSADEEMALLKSKKGFISSETLLT